MNLVLHRTISCFAKYAVLSWIVAGNIALTAIVKPIHSSQARFYGIYGNHSLSQQFLNYKECDKSLQLVKAFCSADIPLYKLRNSALKKFLNDSGVVVPSESSSRRYMEKLVEEHVQKLINYFKDCYIFLICDETEINGVKYVNILAGNIETPKIIYCLACDSMAGSVDSESIISSILECLAKFNIPVNNVVLFVSDAARYMIKAGAYLKVQNYNLFHVTCIAHLIHNCAIQVKSYYEDVNSLISSIKLLLLKNKTRRRLFVEIGMPPDVIVTRWSSWLRCSSYYAKNLPRVKEIVLNLDDDGIIERKAKISVEQPSLCLSLISIKRCHENLIKGIEEIEMGNAGIKDCYEMVKNFDFKEDPCKLKNI